MTIVSVGRAGVSHAHVIAALHAACFAEAWNAASIMALLEMPGACAHLAVTKTGGEKTPVGLVLCRGAASECEILTIGVDPAHRRGGVATALLDAAVATARRQGIVEMFLEVAEDNPGALAFYQGAGFAPVGRRGGYYVRGPGIRVDALILRRGLTEA